MSELPIVQKPSTKEMIDRIKESSCQELYLGLIALERLRSINQQETMKMVKS